MKARPYQEACVEATLTKWDEFDRLLGVAPTGAGKCLLAAWITQRRLSAGRVAIIAHRMELLEQMIDKLWRSTGIAADLEKAEHRARLSAQVVVGSVQTLSARKNRFPRDHFATFIVDEGHHSTSDSYQAILAHFGRSEDNPNGAKVLGVTATPDRSDKRNLGEYFQALAFEINLLDLIRDGYLSPIVCRTIPLKIDLRSVRKVAGDFQLDDVGDALAPVLRQVVASIVEHAAERKTVIFLPLRATSRQFQKLCTEAGLPAWHVDGESHDRKEVLAEFSRAPRGVLCNSMLLTEGWDEPSVDCVSVLRPTQSRALYSQMIGRGTRLYPGKKELLILDFLWQVEKHSLIKPANLVVKDATAAAEVNDLIDEKAEGNADGLLFEIAGDGQGSLELDVEGIVSEAQIMREAKLRRELEKQRQKQGNFVDPLAFALDLDAQAVVDFEPSEPWHSRPITTGQRKALENNGLDASALKNCGHAAAMLDTLAMRRDMGLATPKQINFLRKHKHPSPTTATFDEARAFLTAKFGQWKNKRAA